MGFFGNLVIVSCIIAQSPYFGKLWDFPQSREKYGSFSQPSKILRKIPEVSLDSVEILEKTLNFPQNCGFSAVL